MFFVVCVDRSQYYVNEQIQVEDHENYKEYGIICIIVISGHHYIRKIGSRNCNIQIP